LTEIFFFFAFFVEEATVKMKTAIFLPIIGSIFLIILFFLRNQIIYILVAILSFSSFMAITFVFFPAWKWLAVKLKLEKQWTYASASRKKKAKAFVERRKNFDTVFLFLFLSECDGLERFRFRTLFPHWQVWRWFYCGCLLAVGLSPTVTEFNDLAFFFC
jgi:hypothetical protein